MGHIKEGDYVMLHNDNIGEIIETLDVDSEVPIYDFTTISGTFFFRQYICYSDIKYIFDKRPDIDNIEEEYPELSL